MKRKVLQLLLSVSLLVTSIPVNAYAVENIGGVEEEALGEIEVSDDLSEITSEESVEDIISSEIFGDAEDVFFDETLDAENSKNEEVFDTLMSLGYEEMDLSAEDIADKKALVKSINNLSTLKAGVDYSDNKIVYMADSKEEAEKIASCYGATLNFYSYGVASAIVDFADELDAVAADASLKEVVPTDIVSVFELAADTSNNLPAVYPSMNYKLDDIDMQDLEAGSFDVAINSVENELLTGANVTLNTGDPWSEYQYMHKYIDDYKAWDAGITGKNVTVAVIDTGANLNHPDLKANLRDDGYNPIALDEEYREYAKENGLNVYTDENDPTDDQGHGSHCSGIVAAVKGNGVGGCGVAPDAKILPIKVMTEEGSGITEWIVAGINYAAKKNVDVISMSLGGPYDELEGKAVVNAINKGVTVVAAAGNESTSDKAYPAAYPGVISVGSLCNQTDTVERIYSMNARNKTQEGFDAALSELAKFDDSGELLTSYFSNYGDWVKIACPGSTILSTYYGETGSGYDYFISSGTSQATPGVAGVAALVLSAVPDLKPEDVEEIILGSTDGKIYTRSDNYSFVTLDCGMVNADTAVASAKLEPEKPVFSGYRERPDGTIIASPEDYLVINSNAKILYTDNGKDPIKYGLEYLGPISLDFNGEKTFKAVSVVRNKYSEVAEFTGDFRVYLTKAPILDSKIQILPGKSVNVSVTSYPENAYTEYNYEVDNDEFFTISNKGVLKAKSGADAVGKSATVKVTDEVTGLYSTVVATITDAKLEIKKPAKEVLNEVSTLDCYGVTKPAFIDLYSLLITDNPDVANADMMSLKSSKPAFAYIENGVLYAKKPGTTSITAMLKDGSNKKISFNVKVIASTLSFNLVSDTGFYTSDETIPLAPIGNVKCKVKLSAKLNDDDELYAPSNKKIIWSSSNENVVKVSNKGVVTPARGVGYGQTATVTATTDDGTNIVRSINFKTVMPVTNIWMLGYKLKYNRLTGYWDQVFNRRGFAVTKKMTSVSATTDNLDPVGPRFGNWGLGAIQYVGVGRDVSSWNTILDESWPFNPFYITNTNPSAVDIREYWNQYYPLSKGKAKITYLLRDGSGKKLTFNINVNLKY